VNDAALVQPRAAATGMAIRVFALGFFLVAFATTAFSLADKVPFYDKPGCCRTVIFSWAKEPYQYWVILVTCGCIST
jgi:hypothetical protein